MENQESREQGRSAIGAVGRGIAAGLVGTALMTAWQELAASLKRHAMVSMPREDEDPWKRAPAPAQLAKRVLEGAFGIEVPASKIPFFTNAVHWGYGTGMGTVYGLAQSTRRTKASVGGPAFGAGVWAMSYATLVPLGLYEWPWKYSVKTIAKDVSYHLVYGAGTAAGYELAARLSRRSRA